MLLIKNAKIIDPASRHHGKQRDVFIRKCKYARPNMLSPGKKTCAATLLSAKHTRCDIGVLKAGNSDIRSAFIFVFYVV